MLPCLLRATAAFVFRQAIRSVPSDVLEELGLVDAEPELDLDSARSNLCGVLANPSTDTVSERIKNEWPQLIGGVPVDLVAVFTRGVEVATSIEQWLWISRVDCVQEELTTLLQLMGQPDPGFPILSE